MSESALRVFPTGMFSVACWAICLFVIAYAFERCATLLFQEPDGKVPGFVRVLPSIAWLGVFGLVVLGAVVNFAF